VTRRQGAIAALAIFGLIAGWLLFVGLPRWYGARQAPGAAAAGAAPAAPAAAVRKITATLFYVSEDGMSLTQVQRDAFVDLSGEITAKHPGGSLDEIFTVYTIVNALTVNLPAITRVQILVDGKEVDTLAGHVDLRHPLAKSLDWVLHDTH